MEEEKSYIGLFVIVLVGAPFVYFIQDQQTAQYLLYEIKSIVNLKYNAFYLISFIIFMIITFYFLLIKVVNWLGLKKIGQTSSARKKHLKSKEKEEK